MRLSSHLLVAITFTLTVIVFFPSLNNKLVLALSHNDGCVSARINETKAWANTDTLENDIHELLEHDYNSDDLEV